MSPLNTSVYSCTIKLNSQMHWCHVANTFTISWISSSLLCFPMKACRLILEQIYRWIAYAWYLLLLCLLYRMLKCGWLTWIKPMESSVKLRLNSWLKLEDSLGRSKSSSVLLVISTLEKAPYWMLCWELSKLLIYSGIRVQCVWVYT